jgi:hypothetical protein
MRLPLRRNQAATVDPTVETLQGSQSLPRILGVAAGLAVVAWLLVKGSENVEQFAIVTFNGITLSALFFVVASGFTLLGGYLAFEIQKAWFAKESEGINISLAARDRHELGHQRRRHIEGAEGARTMPCAWMRGGVSFAPLWFP